MKSPTSDSEFKTAVRRGRDFEGRERRLWRRLDSGSSKTEAHSNFGNRSGRIDIRVDEQGDYVSVVELKASDWDRIAPHRIRPTALRHARQVWRYANAELANGTEVCAGIIYERAPGKSTVRAIVEDILNDRCVQVVWRENSHRGSQPNKRLHPTAAGVIQRGRG